MIRLEWFNQYSGVYVESPNGNVIFDMTDADPGKYEKIDVIVITHEHPDHFDVELVRYAFEIHKCMILSDVFSYKELVKYISRDKIKPIKPGSIIKLGNLRFFVGKSKHKAFLPVTVILDINRKFKIYHTSDSLPFEEMKSFVEKHKPINVLFCAVGMAPNVNPSSAAEIAKIVQPEVAIPYHGTKLQEFCDLLKYYQIKCKILEKGSLHEI